MMGWNCADCGKEIQDTRYHRELQLEDRQFKKQTKTVTRRLRRT